MDDNNKKKDDYSFDTMLMSVLLQTLKRKGIFTQKEIDKMIHEARAALTLKMVRDFQKDTEDRK